MFSIEYSLLQPRSALIHASQRLTPAASQRGPRTPTQAQLFDTGARPTMGGSLEHHPFSGQVHSAGELLHTHYRMPLPAAHRPAVWMNLHFVGSLDERSLGYLKSALGSSRVASPAYQKWPT